MSSRTRSDGSFGQHVGQHPGPQSGLHLGRSTAPDSVLALLHDLRQPLAAMRILSEASEDLAGSIHSADSADSGRAPDAGRASDSQADRLRAIHRQVLWLSELVEDVLGTARSLTVPLCDAAAVVDEVASRARVTAVCPITVEADVRTFAAVDARTLGRALGCVVDNAVRAAQTMAPEVSRPTESSGTGGAAPTRRHPGVHISLGQVGDETVVLVQDDGPGLGRVTSQNAMGLTITRALLATCGGTFSLRPAPSRGALARISVPTAGSAKAVAS